jgi:hypothetical protein
MSNFYFSDSRSQIIHGLFFWSRTIVANSTDTNILALDRFEVTCWKRIFWYCFRVTIQFMFQCWFSKIGNYSGILLVTFAACHICFVTGEIWDQFQWWLKKRYWFLFNWYFHLRFKTICQRLNLRNWSHKYTFPYQNTYVVSCINNILRSTFYTTV